MKMDIFQNKKRHCYKKEILFSSLLLLFLFTSCQQSPDQTPGNGTQQAAPTLHSFFSQGGQSGQGKLEETKHPQSGPTVAGIFNLGSTPTPVLTSTSILPVVIAEKTQPVQLSYTIKTVYDDALNPDWIVLEQKGMDFTDSNGPFVFQGERALVVTPKKDYGALFFTVKPQDQSVYPRQRVLGLSFWINGGENSIEIGELAVTIVGSNDYTYYLPDDRSAYITNDPPFSETRLYYLGFNRSIPPKTWVKVQIWLADLIYDPYYKYVTGFYIKNDQGFYNTFYLDEVSLTLLKDETSSLPPQSITPILQPTNTLTQVVTPSPTIQVTRTRTSTVTRIPTRTPLPTATRTPTRTITLTPSMTFTRTSTRTPTSTHTKLPTWTSTATRTPTSTRTPSATPTPSLTATPR